MVDDEWRENSGADDALTATLGDQAGGSEGPGGGHADRQHLNTGDEGLFAHREIDAGDLVVLHPDLAGLRPATMRAGRDPERKNRKQDGDGGETK